MTYAGGYHNTVNWGGGTFNVIFDRPAFEVPTATGPGPTGWSTSAELERDPVLIHDVNLYYRSLGLEWPFRGITRNQLMRAYQKVGGEKNVYATYAFKMLLDKEIRRKYDRAPFGSWMLDDHIKEMLKRRAAWLVKTAAEQAGPYDRIPTIDEVFVAWGVVAPDAVDSNEPVADADRPFADAVQNPLGTAEGDDTFPESWPWGYWLWRSRCRDTERLARWQELLLHAAREAGLRAHLAVGFVGRSDSHFVRVEDSRTGQVALLLHEHQEPTAEMAALAVTFEQGKTIKARPVMINPT